MTQYLIAVHDEPGSRERSMEEMQPIFEAVEAYNADLQEKGHWVFAGGLTDPSDATVVDGRGNDVMVTDGPYLETKEHLGGFWVVEADDLDVALRLAAAGSRACGQRVEVRPFQGE